MKRKAKKSAAWKEKQLTTAELKKLSAGLHAAYEVVVGVQRQGQALGSDPYRPDRDKSDK